VAAEDGRSWSADCIVIAVGCRAAPLPVPGGELALAYQDIWTLKALPQRVTVIGGADTGCQMASIFADFGVDVRLIEAGPRLVPGAHVLGEYSAETVQVVAAAMSAGLNVEQLAEIQFAFPTFTEAVSMAAQMACHTIGIGRFPPSWSYLGSPE
jgi:pyruvate/2-oxoglutarate dehydrogenase complex dihydrolipoamide dehydrogenase (E3) component